MRGVCFIDKKESEIPMNLKIAYTILSDLQRRGLLRVSKVNCGNEYMISYAIYDGMSWVHCSERLPDDYEMDAAATQVSRETKE